MKKLALCLCISALAIPTNVLHTKHLVHKLKHSALKILDGAAFGIDAPTVFDIRKVQRSLSAIKAPLSQQTKNPTEYEFRGKKYTFQELVDLEQSFEGTKEYDAIVAELQPTLEKAIADFNSIVGSFVSKIQKTKKLVVEVIKESCELREYKESLLLGWADTDDEKVYFKEKVKSFSKFDEFCTHLQNFFLDLIYSCPIGWQQYLDAKKKIAEQK